MVRVRSEKPLDEEGSVDINQWIQDLVSRGMQCDPARIRKACDLSLQGEEKAIATHSVWIEGHSSFQISIEMADILAELQIDEDGLIAGIVYRAVREKQLTLTHIRKQFGNTVADLVDGVLRMALISDVNLADGTHVLGQENNQREQARRLIVSLVSDIRIALIKLAERTSVIRARVKMNYARKEKLAHEVMEIYAPLAHRLGIGYLKWELEDLSFRVLEPEWYQRIARMLASKLSERQEFIERVVETLEDRLNQAGIEAEIEGRAKHIYSIWNKMKKKGVSFSQVYDIHAFRILVDTVEQCYSVLGIVHGLWRNIPNEFDDYIAAPKENGYKSLHTAVLGPEGALMEIQIRTREMHEEAEYGLCSHWTYKAHKELSETEAYQERLQWLRQLIDWQEEETGEFFELARDLMNEVSADRIYVYTPDGHVIDLPPLATPVDFAYRVHTEIGHRCRGARINGRVMPLNTVLRSGDQVHIITGNENEPRREWLHDHLGYISTSRARLKVQSWFGKQEREKKIKNGMKVLLEELEHLSLDDLDMNTLGEQSGFSDSDEMFMALGSGEIGLERLLDSLAHTAGFKTDDMNFPESREAFIRGAEGFKTRMASCCAPASGDEIRGLLAKKGLVEIHKQDCTDIVGEEKGHIEIKVEWAYQKQNTFPVRIEIVAIDRYGLLFDITDILMKESTNVESINTIRDKKTKQVHLTMDIQVTNLKRLVKILDKIERISNVIGVKRKLVT